MSGILVPGKTDVTNLAGLLRLQHRLHRPALGENPVRDLPGVRFHGTAADQSSPSAAAAGFLDLLRRQRLRATVNLGHQKNLLAITVAQRLAHALLARAAVVIPAVVHERDAAVHRRPDQLDALLLVALDADVITAQADGRNLLAGPPQRPVNHPALRLPRPCFWSRGHGHTAGNRELHEIPPAHARMAGRPPSRPVPPQ